MRYVASCSFGKDSVATVILAHIHGDPLDEVVYCRVMFDDHTSAEVPEHEQFIQEVAIPRFQSWGIKVTVIQAEGKNFVERFHRLTSARSKTPGKMWSWPVCGKCYVQRDLKLAPINRWKNSIDRDTIQYIGIASDEQERLLRLDGVSKISLLDKYGLTEADAMELCREYGLLSPIYDFTGRGGVLLLPQRKRPGAATPVQAPPRSVVFPAVPPGGPEQDHGALEPRGDFLRRRRPDQGKSYTRRELTSYTFRPSKLQLIFWGPRFRPLLAKE